MDSLWWYYFEMELEFDGVSGNGGAARVEMIDEALDGCVVRRRGRGSWCTRFHLRWDDGLEDIDDFDITLATLVGDWIGRSVGCDVLEWSR